MTHNPFSSLCFSHESINHELLKQRAYNYRWAEQAPDVIPLTAADPDFSLAPPIRDALNAYISQGSLAYGPTAGLPEYREAVAQDLRSGGVDAHAEQVLATDGAASAMFLVMKAVIKAGDEVIIFDPVDFLFERSVVAVGGTTVRVPFSRESGLDLESLSALAARPKVKMIALCAPHNPFGRLLRNEEISFVAQLAEQYNLLILSDEVWGKLSYDTPQAHTASNALAASRTYTVSGFSKSFGLAGLRIGYIHAPTLDLAHQLIQTAHAGDTAFGASTLSQVAAVAGLQEASLWFEAFRLHLKQARSEICRRLDQLEGLTCPVPEATYLASPYFDPKAWPIGLSSEDLSQLILKWAKVAVVPGSPQFFGAGAEGLIRLSFATSLDTIHQAMTRIESAWPRIRQHAQTLKDYTD